MRILPVLFLLSISLAIAQPPPHAPPPGARPPQGAQPAAKPAVVWNGFTPAAVVSSTTLPPIPEPVDPMNTMYVAVQYGPAASNVVCLILEPKKATRSPEILHLCQPGSSNTVRRRGSDYRGPRDRAGFEFDLPDLKARDKDVSVESKLRIQCESRQGFPIYLLAKGKVSRGSSGVDFLIDGWLSQRAVRGGGDLQPVPLLGKLKMEFMPKPSDDPPFLYARVLCGEGLYLHPEGGSAAKLEVEYAAGDKVIRDSVSPEKRDWEEDPGGFDYKCPLRRLKPGTYNVTTRLNLGSVLGMVEDKTTVTIKKD
jgi:hypothetical protein